MDFCNFRIDLPQSYSAWRVPTPIQQERSDLSARVGGIFKNLARTLESCTVQFGVAIIAINQPVCLIPDLLVGDDDPTTKPRSPVVPPELKPVVLRGGIRLCVAIKRVD